jgi:DNA-binding CsgD family transcriptional regulator
MSKIPEQWREAALSFALDVAQEGENFPKKVLAMLDKHFGFQRSIFFPHNYSLMGGCGIKRSTALSNYITYGISYGPMYDYKDHVYKDDIFHYSKLPAHLKKKRVLFTNDVMPFQEFEKTPFGVHMIAMDMYYQACLFLYEGDRVIASIALLRSYNEKRFDEEDRALLEYLCQLIEVNYHNFLNQSGEAKFLDGFNLFFQDMKMGAVILNQDLTVIQANQMAREISRLFWEQFRNNQSHFLRSNYQGEEQYREVQTMVNEISEKLTIKGNNSLGNNSLTLSSVGGEITFYHTSFLSANASGAIQTWHMLAITNKTKELPQNIGHPYNSLTQQERRIAYFLATGMKNEQIAEELHISIYTVRTHIANIYKKFEVGNKIDLLMCLQPYLQEKTGS